MEEEAFFAKIQSEFWEDLPRLVYADWLEEQGRFDRAEFIRVQIELFNALDCDYPDQEKVEELRQNEAQILVKLAESEPNFLSRISFADRLTTERGFLEVMGADRRFLETYQSENRESIGNERWPILVNFRNSRTLRLMGTIDEIMEQVQQVPMIIGTTPWVWLEMMQTPQVARQLASRLDLSEIHLNDHNIDPNFLDAIRGMSSRFDMPCPLQELRLQDNEIDDAGLQLLINHLQHLPNLKALDLSGNIFGDPGLQALIESPLIQQLKVLRLNRLSGCSPGLIERALRIVNPLPESLVSNVNDKQRRPSRPAYLDPRPTDSSVVTRIYWLILFISCMRWRILHPVYAEADWYDCLSLLPLAFIVVLYLNSMLAQRLGSITMFGSTRPAAYLVGVTVVIVFGYQFGLDVVFRMLSCFAILTIMHDLAWRRMVELRRVRFLPTYQEFDYGWVLLACWSISHTLLLLLGGTIRNSGIIFVCMIMVYCVFLLLVGRGFAVLNLLEPTVHQFRLSLITRLGLCSLVTSFFHAWLCKILNTDRTPEGIYLPVLVGWIASIFSLILLIPYETRDAALLARARRMRHLGKDLALLIIGSVISGLLMVASFRLGLPR
jgi:uncharacterized protein (TIGR02996 family)